LDVLQVDHGGVKEVVMNGLGMGPRLVLPGGDRALVQAEGGDDGLGRAAVGQQGDDANEQDGVLVQSVEGRARGGGEGLAAGGAAVASLGVGVDLDDARGGLAAGRAAGIGTELRFIRRERAPGLKGADMLIPLGVAL
jgi:hypothetical protein